MRLYSVKTKFSQALFFSRALFSQKIASNIMGGMGTRVKSRLKKPSLRHFIREWRKFRGLNQEQLAERVGVAVSSISQLETMKQGYSQPTLEAIADALRCTPADLLMRDPSQPEAIWTIWDQLDPPAKIQAIQILETFRKTGTGN